MAMKTAATSRQGVRTPGAPSPPQAPLHPAGLAWAAVTAALLGRCPGRRHAQGIRRQDARHHPVPVPHSGHRKGPLDLERGYLPLKPCGAAILLTAQHQQLPR
jgi:hypothetical protein